MGDRLHSIKGISGPSAIRSWTLRYTYPGGERFATGWKGTWSQSGDIVTVSNESWDGSLAPDSSVQIHANFDNQGSSSASLVVSCTGTRTGTVATARPSVPVSAPATPESSSQSPGAPGGTSQLGGDQLGPRGAANRLRGTFRLRSPPWHQPDSRQWSCRALLPDARRAPGLLGHRG